MFVCSFPDVPLIADGNISQQLPQLLHNRGKFASFSAQLPKVIGQHNVSEFI